MSLLKKVIEPTEDTHGIEYRDRLEDGYNIISPSGIKNFYTDIKTWKKNVIDKEQTFFGNDSTYLGSIIHKFCKLHRTNGLTKDNKLPSIEVDKILSSSSDLDIKTIYKDYPLMNEAVLNAYLELYPTNVKSEYYMEYELDNKVLIAGTVDEIDDVNKVCVDFKTSKSPYKERKDLALHFPQLCVYVALYEKLHGIELDTLRIVNIARPTKTIGSRVTILECDSDIEYGRKLINEVYAAILACRDNPTLIDILFKDNPFDGFTMPNKDKLEIFCDDKIKNFKVITQEENKVAKIKKNIFA